MTAWMNTIHCQWLCTLCLLLIALFIFFFADSKNFIYEDGAYKTTDWMNYVRCQWFPIFCLLLIALLIFLCLFFAYCLCCFTYVYCSQSRDIASAKIRILQILWQWIVMALVVYLLTYLCIRSWVLRTYSDDDVDTTRYDTRCYFNVRSKANMSQLNLMHGTDNWKV